MVKTNLILDTRRQLLSGRFPVRIYFSLNRKTFLLSTGVEVKADEWDDGFIKGNTPEVKRLNLYISNQKMQVDNALMALELRDELKTLTPTQLNCLIQGKDLKEVEKRKEKLYTVRDHFQRIIATKEKVKTRETYEETLRIMERFTNMDKFLFEHLNYEFLKNLEQHLSHRSVNGRSVVFRNIRAVYNDAINMDKASLSDYPFRKFKIKKEATRKRSLDVEELRQIRDCECEPHIEKYRDIFMLIFYCIGINTVDLLGATNAMVNKGRLEYKRAKTGRLHSVKLEPEALAIINRYKGDTLLLDFMECRKMHKDFSKRINGGLRKIGEYSTHQPNNAKLREPICSELTTYWARHTWATIAAELDIPDAVISAALGHAGENRTTDIYIKRSIKKVDEANRKVIDYLFSKEVAQ